MKSFDELKHGDRIISNGYYRSVYTVYEYRGELYLTGIKDMWPVTEFNPSDWELLDQEGIITDELRR